MYNENVGSVRGLGRIEPQRFTRVSQGSPPRHWAVPYAAQQGETDPGVKPLQGFGGGSVLEIVTHHRGDTWRTVYTVRYPEAIYVPHAFQKKSKRGASTPQRDVRLIHRRLGEAERRHRERQN
jgi:phage-related protein